MNDVEVLILHGPPGSGKSTVAESIEQRLRLEDKAIAVIDIDEIARVWPPQGPTFSQKNLASIWPQYAIIPDLKVIIPTVIDDQEEHQFFVETLKAKKLMVCELTAPEDSLKQRVFLREPNDKSIKRLLQYVDSYHTRDDHQHIRDFQVSTHNRPISDSVNEVLEKAGWL